MAPRPSRHWTVKIGLFVVLIFNFPALASFFRPRWLRFFWLNDDCHCFFHGFFWLWLFWRDFWVFLILLEIDRTVLTNFLDDRFLPDFLTQIVLTKDFWVFITIRNWPQCFDEFSWRFLAWFFDSYMTTVFSYMNFWLRLLRRRCHLPVELRLSEFCWSDVDVNWV